MGGVGILEIRTAVTDTGAEFNNRGLFIQCFGIVNRLRQSFNIIAIAFFDANDIPAIGLIAFGNVFGKGQFSFAVDGNVVIIINHDQVI